MYKGSADWTKIAEVKNNQRMKIPVFGNGDVNSPEKALEMRDKFGLDGAMIGRAPQLAILGFLMKLNTFLKINVIKNHLLFLKEFLWLRDT